MITQCIFSLAHGCTSCSLANVIFFWSSSPTFNRLQNTLLAFHFGFGGLPEMIRGIEQKYDYRLLHIDVGRGGHVGRGCRVSQGGGHVGRGLGFVLLSFSLSLSLSLSSSSSARATRRETEKIRRP